jgi:hypothetical protein
VSPIVLVDVSDKVLKDPGLWWNVIFLE